MTAIGWTVLITVLVLGFKVRASERPNIIFFLVDDMGWQDTSLPFWDKPTPFNRHFRTPNMERLAKQGRRFTQAYACAVCSPTRTSIMTGQNAARHRVTNWTLYEDRETSGKTPRLLPPRDWKKQGLQPGKAPILPEVLRDQLGYQTIHAGKAHWGAYDTQGSDPLTLGFDVNIAGHAAGGPGHYHGEKNYGNSEAGGRTRPWGIPGLEAYHGSDTHLTEVLTLEAQKAITDSIEDRKPFYLYMAHYAVHAPIQPHDAYMSNYHEKNYPGTQIPIPENEARYASMVEGMDASLGALLRHVESLGVAENTLIIFASDNGTLSLHARGNSPRNTGRDTHSWPLREGKGSAYEGGTRVPLIVSWARLDSSAKAQQSLAIPSNSVSETQVIVEDFFPTIIRCASGKRYRSETRILDGVDFTEALLGEPSPDSLLNDRSLIFHYPHQWTGQPQGGYQPHSAIRQGDWKAIYFYENRTWELYHLSQDIGESLDLSQSYPGELNRLATTLKQKLIDRGADWPVSRERNEDFPLMLP
ncbi:sulfatase [bacterium]|nr:sulfatase [bacterium]